MTALSADAIRLTRGVPLSETYVVTSGVTLYHGGLVNVSTSTGLAVAGTSAASRKFVGLCKEGATGNAAGSVFVTVEYGHEALFDTAAGVTVALVGADLCISDDNTLDTSASIGSNQVKVGEMISLAATQKAWVAIRRFCGVVA